MSLPYYKWGQTSEAESVFDFVLVGVKVTSSTSDSRGDEPPT
jgi:hypothetical protein